jgi:predicted site-specific integrase-resolvase
MDGDWVSTKRACKFYGVSGNTIRKWGDMGSVECKRTPGCQRRFLLREVSMCQDKLGNPAPSNDIKNFVYARVSSSKQKQDLERQVAFLRDKYPDHSVVKDIGSGLNNKRRGFLKLLEQSRQGKVGEVVVSSKDRMSRFGFDLVEWVFTQNGTSLVVLDHEDKTPEQELTEDILSVLQVFACRHFGRRKYTLNKNKENQVEAEFFTEEETQGICRDVSICV